MKHRGSIKIFLLIVFCLILIALIVLLWLNNLNFKNLISQPGDQGLSFPQSEDAMTRQAKLYFGVEGNAWQIETREIIMQSLQLEDRIKDVVDALLKGPKIFGNTPIPKGTQLIKLYLDEDDHVYLDFSNQIRENHPGGTWGEMATIYSVVNTVMENFHTIKGVKILVMGKEIETLKGHIDTRYPFFFRDQL